MSFLDNLESNLKALESREERSSVRKQPSERDRSKARAVQPYAEQLRNSPFTKQLLDSAVALAHRVRTKVYIGWAGNCLRLDAREHRLELQPTPGGIVAVFSSAGVESGREAVDLRGDPEKLARAFVNRIEVTAPVAAAEER